MSIQSIAIEKNNEQIDYNPIYKVNQIVDGVIDSVYVFYGQPIVKNNEKEIVKKLFTPTEIENIKNIYFSEKQIHRDDTIGVIKLKILSELRKKVPLGEIYLFCKKIEYLNPTAIFQSLTQNKKIKLTYQRLEQFLSNIDNTNGDAFIMPEKKDEYELNDIINPSSSSYVNQSNNIFVEFTEDYLGYANCICFYLDNDINNFCVSPPN